MDRGEDMGVMIDDAVPMPSARGVRRYPYEDMGVGQSFYEGGLLGGKRTWTCVS